MISDFFALESRGTNLRTEVRAGVATFLMMAYIVVVNPSILENAGMPFAGVLFATVLVTALSSISMGLFANLPYAVAPGMGINAFFTFSLVVGQEIPWPTALGAIFLSGLVFILLSISGLRTALVIAIPQSLRWGLAAGIGLFLALIGLTSVNFVVADPATVVGFGGLNAVTLLFSLSLVFTATLVIRKIPGALILGIAATSLAAWALSRWCLPLGWLDAPLVTLPEIFVAAPSFEVLGRLDILSALKWGMIMPIFALLFVDLFDSIGSFVGVAEAADLVDEDGVPKEVGRALLVDAFSTTLSGLVGSSSGTVYVESVAGIEEGGRSGLTAVVTGLLFLPLMFFSPLLAFIPAVATAPVLVLVGVFMCEPLCRIPWKNLEESLPAFLATVLIPLTYSITQGVIWGFLSYTVIKVLLGKAREVHWILFVVDALAVLSLLSIG